MHIRSRLARRRNAAADRGVRAACSAAAATQLSYARRGRRQARAAASPTRPGGGRAAAAPPRRTARRAARAGGRARTGWAVGRRRRPSPPRHAPPHPLERDSLPAGRHARAVGGGDRGGGDRGGVGVRQAPRSSPRPHVRLRRSARATVVAASLARALARRRGPGRATLAQLSPLQPLLGELCPPQRRRGALNRRRPPADGRGIDTLSAAAFRGSKGGEPGGSGFSGSTSAASCRPPPGGNQLQGVVPPRQRRAPAAAAAMAVGGGAALGELRGGGERGGGERDERDGLNDLPARAALLGSSSMVARRPRTPPRRVRPRQTRWQRARRRARPPTSFQRAGSRRGGGATTVPYQYARAPKRTSSPDAAWRALRICRPTTRRRRRWARWRSAESTSRAVAETRHLPRRAAAAAGGGAPERCRRRRRAHRRDAGARLASAPARISTAES